MQEATQESNFAPQPQSMRNEMGLLTEQELADMLGYKVLTLVTWRQQGRGPDYTKLGKTIFYRREAVQEWIKRNETPVART
jgi:predicted DNA-binding transcriptional regulator AlpA